MLERKALGPIAVKFLETPGQFRATFATLNVIDKDGDVTVPGAFTAGQEVRIAQWGHNWSALPIGRGVIHANDAEAWVDGELFLDTVAGKESYTVIKNLGALQEWSYGFAIKERSFGEFGDPPQQVQFLRRLDVFEVSPVMIGAGVDTGTDAIKGDRERLQEVEARLHADAATIARRYGELATLEAKAGRALSQARIDRITADTDALGALIATLIATRDDLRAMLDEVTPAGDGKGLGPAEIIEIEKMRARFLGVAI